MRTIQQHAGRRAVAAGADRASRPHRVGDLGWLIHRQGMLYNQQFGWNGGFEALIAGIYREFHELPGDAAQGPVDRRAATASNRRLGLRHAVRAERRRSRSCGCSMSSPRRGDWASARLLVDQVVALRATMAIAGCGCGRRRSLSSARQDLCRLQGFKMVETGPHHSFGKDLIGEYWELEL